MPSYKRNNDRDGKPQGTRPGKKFSDNDPFERSPRKSSNRTSGDGDHKSDRTRSEGFRGRPERTSDRGEKRSFRQKDGEQRGEGGRGKSGDFKPRTQRSDDRDEKRPYRSKEGGDRPERRNDRTGDFKPRTSRSDDRDAKPSFRKKEGGERHEGGHGKAGDFKSRAPRRENLSGEDRPFTGKGHRDSGADERGKGKTFRSGSDDRGDKRAFQKRDDDRPKKNYRTRDDNPTEDHGKRTFSKRTDEREEKPFVKPGKGYRKDLADKKQREEPASDGPDRKRFKKSLEEFRKYDQDDKPSRRGDSRKGRSDDRDFEPRQQRFSGKKREDDDQDDWDDDYNDRKSHSKKGKYKEEEQEAEMPLNKYIAHSGECSRRDAAELVKQGKVKVNDELILDPGHKVNRGDRVTLSGKKLILQKGMVYVLLNKPKGYITTTEDEKGRRTVIDIVQDAAPDSRLYPVGRLDRNTTGLLLITNDGVLAQKLSHPSFNTKKVYQVTLDKQLTKADFEKLMKGIELEDGPAKADELAYLENKNEIGIEIHSGKNRIVRRMFESMGYVVEKLDRVMYAGLTKKNLPRGKWRFLSEREIVLLKHFKS